MRILLTGASGQLGGELITRLRSLGKVLATSRTAPSPNQAIHGPGAAFHALDLSDPTAIEHLVKDFRPDVIVHAAAYTRVDDAEMETALARRVNAEATATLANVGAVCGSAIVYFSTDYVFDGSGERPWRETDTPAPLNRYGVSKLAGEAAIRQATARHLIIRVSWLYGPRGRNFAKTVLQRSLEGRTLRIVNDQIGAPTPAWFAAERSCRLLQRIHDLGWPTESSGTFHLSARGTASWYDFAKALLLGSASLGNFCSISQLVPISSAQFGAPAQRPLNSRLDCSKLERLLDSCSPTWQSGLGITLPSILAAVLAESKLTNST
ncbi:MAG: dTDP-4-dehydrorhamnose reductase [Pirellulales bacterium]